LRCRLASFKLYQEADPDSCGGGQLFLSQTLGCASCANAISEFCRRHFCIPDREYYDILGPQTS